MLKKNLKLSFKRFYSTLVYEVKRSSTNILNIYLKPNWLIILFSISVPLSVCRIVGTLKVIIHFWMHPVYFCRFIVQQNYSSIFDKWYSIVKRHLNPSYISCLDHAKHISRTAIIEANTISVFLFLFLSLIIMSHWTFFHSLKFALVFF